MNGTKQTRGETKCGKFRCDTVAAGFQLAFLVSEAFRGLSWRFNGAGVMPAPYFFQFCPWPCAVIATAVLDARDLARALPLAGGESATVLRGGWRGTAGGVFRPIVDISSLLCDVHRQVENAHVFIMKSPVCICCGEAIPPAGNVTSRNPNMCASCSSVEDGNAGPVPSREEAAPETREDIAKLRG
jgi:hypothetical protein